MPTKPPSSAERARTALLADREPSNDDLYALVCERLAAQERAQKEEKAQAAPAPRAQLIRRRAVAAMTRRAKEDRCPTCEGSGEYQGPQSLGELAAYQAQRDRKRCTDCGGTGARRAPPGPSLIECAAGCGALWPDDAKERGAGDNSYRPAVKDGALVCNICGDQALVRGAAAQEEERRLLAEARAAPACATCGGGGSLPPVLGPAGTGRTPCPACAPRGGGP